jgi:hypothetical protein
MENENASVPELQLVAPTATSSGRTEELERTVVAVGPPLDPGCARIATNPLDDSIHAGRDVVGGREHQDEVVLY